MGLIIVDFTGVKNIQVFIMRLVVATYYNGWVAWDLLWYLDLAMGG